MEHLLIASQPALATIPHGLQAAAVCHQTARDNLRFTACESGCGATPRVGSQFKYCP